MTSYSISGFSFNIGSTTTSQEYVPLVKEDVPWGINSTYIYKAPTLRDQFDDNNKHLVIENRCLTGNIIFKTQGTEKIIINDLSVGTINGLPYNGSGSGVGLTADSVNSSHIINGSILGTDISDATITGSNIADGAISQEKLDRNLISNLFEFNRRLYNLEHPGWYGTFKVKNNNASDANATFSFTLEALTPISVDEVNTVNLYPYTVLSRNEEVTITRPIQSRLENKDTTLMFNYTLSSGNPITTNNYDLSGLTVIELSNTYIAMTVSGNFIHNGTIQFGVTV